VPPPAPPTLGWPPAAAADSRSAPRRCRQLRIGRRKTPAAEPAAAMAAVAAAVAAAAAAVAAAVAAAAATAVESSVAAAAAVECATRSRDLTAGAARPPSRRPRPPWPRRVSAVWRARWGGGRISGRNSREPPPPPSASRSGLRPAAAPVGGPRTPAAAHSICYRWEAGADGRPPCTSHPSPTKRAPLPSPKRAAAPTGTDQLRPRRAAAAADTSTVDSRLCAAAGPAPGASGCLCSRASGV